MKNIPSFCAILFAFQLTSINAIYNGTAAKQHKYPHTVLVHSPQFFCTGALISDRHVLTAAHCLMSIRKGGQAKVNVGAHVYYGHGNSDGRTIFSNKFWIHENFTMPSAVFDLGIIELPEPLELSDTIRPIKISTKFDADLDAEDKDVYVAGWGYTNEFSGAANVLQYTEMKLIPLNDCKKFKSHYIEDLNDNHICTEMLKGMPCR